MLEMEERDKRMDRKTYTKLIIGENRQPFRREKEREERWGRGEVLK